MAGHSAWKNIKHKKAASDAKKGKLWSKCARAIIVAAKNGGGNPESNLALKCAIDEARSANLPKDTIEKAIKKGTGELGAEDYEAATYEGYGPGGVAMLIEILTNNRNRSASDIRLIMDKNGGKLGALGCVSYLFAPKGQMLVGKSATNEDTLMSLALDAGDSMAFNITANRFLRGMVRAVVGSLLEVGTGKRSLADFKKIVKGKDRKLAGMNVPPEGLYLVDVKYPKGIFLT